MLHEVTEALAPLGIGATVHLDAWTSLLLALAGVGAGIINGVAGGGTLLSFPVLLALGYPALTANVTSTIGIWPGYAGGMAGLRREVFDQRTLLRLLAPCAIAGAVGGSILLLTTPASTFQSVAPWLVLAAAGLFAVQPALSRVLGQHPGRRHQVALAVCTTLASVYGGYFGAGLGVVLLAVLGLTLPDTILRTSSLRTVLSVLVNGVAALVFIGAASPVWAAAGLIAIGSLVGGFLGVSLLRRLPPMVFRVLVVAIGLVTAIKLLVG